MRIAISRLGSDILRALIRLSGRTRIPAEIIDIQELDLGLCHTDHLIASLLDFDHRFLIFGT
jgi:hypothetical protein